MKRLKQLLLIFIATNLLSYNSLQKEVKLPENETGYDMWLHYKPIKNEDLRTSYLNYASVFSDENNSVVQSVIDELALVFKNMCNSELKIDKNKKDAAIVLQKDERLKKDGYKIECSNKNIIISGQSHAGILYGTFAFIRQMQFENSVENITIEDYPRINLRMLNHWDNLRGDIERGYAGGSIWNWETLPQIEQRYVDYARFLASVGINGTVINNVNANSKMLETEYIVKYKGLADVFRKYGIKLFISANYASPIEIGGLKNADPINPDVVRWWKSKIDEIYSIIPDFGGFLVKADSEGQPGPHMYGRTHAQGANMLAKSFEKHNGLVIWRAFVYGINTNDRAKQSYDFFQPQDGEFAENVILQVKNGPIDFQVHEPVHPLFGAMPKTNQMAELQITQEYTGRQIALNYLVPYWKRVLFFDTYRKGKGSEVYKVVNGELYNQQNTGICGVSNIGSDTNWTGHHLAQANFYGFGRLAWNPELQANEITDEWIKQTFGNNEKLHNAVSNMLMQSYDIFAMNQVPFGTGYFFHGDRISPAPTNHRLEVHKSDTLGIGYDRTVKTGSGYALQYAPELTKLYTNPQTTPKYEILFFHHLPYTYKMKSGKTLIQEIYDYQFLGVEKSKSLLDIWHSIENELDAQRYKEVKERLEKQFAYSKIWNKSLVEFFYTLSEIDDEKGRIAQNIIGEREINLFCAFLDENQSIPTFTLPDIDSILTIEAEKMYFLSPWTVKNEKQTTSISFNENTRSSAKKLRESGLAVCKFELPWGNINYYGHDKIFNFKIKSNRNKTDTLWVKIGEFEFEPWIHNFYSDNWKIFQFKRIGHLLGNGTHTLIIKGLKDGIEIDKIQIIRAEYFVDKK